LGGALFQGLSGLTLSAFSTNGNHAIGYNYLFFMYGGIAIAGLVVLWFLMGPIQKDKSLTAYDGESF
jgi:hypothetical protein